MKFHDGDLIDYVSKYEKTKLRSKPLIPYNELKNIIVYGKSGTGKYSSVLYYLSKFSQSNLRYDKKISITISKEAVYFIRISDIHYEIDMEQLGCNAKQVWHEVYSHIKYIIEQCKCEQVIVCKNFHKINHDLLKVFYSYIQDSRLYNIHFILITDHLSFIPNNIYKSFNIISVPSFTNTQCSKIGKKIPSCTTVNNLKSYTVGFPIVSYNTKLCQELYDYIIQYPNISYKVVREKLYDILIYDVDVSVLIWLLISNCIDLQIKIDDLFIIYINEFYQLYNNNYRPIYHLEKIIYYILNCLHENKKGM